MSLLTPEECIAHCRAELEDRPLLDSLLAAAESAVAGHLNRAVFASGAELEAAQAALPDAAGVAQDAYETAISGAALLLNAAARDMAISVAIERLAEARTGFARTLHGVVANPRILAAVRLTLGNLYANREQVIVGASVSELPQGVPELLRPDRRTMMP
ncbi:head-tail connector protein [Achromobacter anxifer]|uniref:head-tail connector protein n=1 Tax=Achromobacter anxifer TaxID=1287737 RepID=UPI0023F968F3|nr:head-tail connector protein [Achromobacter anxifer]MDF8360146.1 phage gp6-like head-tail connector protein [Achromobacter anxifer]